MPKKKLFVVADDFGVHQIIDDGIMKCIDEGVVDGVDIIVTHESSEDRIKLLVNRFRDQIESGDLRLGLHFNVNVGSPINLENKDEQIDDSVFDEYLGLISLKPSGKKEEDRVFRHRTVRTLIPNVHILGNKYVQCLKQELQAQYDKLEKVSGYKPSHISSHNGVFQAAKELYKVYGKFCMDKMLPMRCPTLLMFDPEKGGLWKDNPKQKLLPIGKLRTADGVGAANGAKEILSWTENGLLGSFRQDLEDGLMSTNYCIEHFFRNSSIQNLRSILDKVRDDQTAHSYEMIVHPILYEDLDQRNSLPLGIDCKKGVIKDRKQEMETLIYELRGAMKIRGIIKYKHT